MATEWGCCMVESSGRRNRLWGYVGSTTIEPRCEEDKIIVIREASSRMLYKVTIFKKKLSGTFFFFFSSGIRRGRGWFDPVYMVGRVLIVNVLIDGIICEKKNMRNWDLQKKEMKNVQKETAVRSDWSPWHFWNKNNPFEYLFPKPAPSLW